MTSIRMAMGQSARCSRAVEIVAGEALHRRRAVRRRLAEPSEHVGRAEDDAGRGERSPNAVT